MARLKRKVPGNQQILLSKFRTKLKNNPTKSESIFKNKLLELGIKFFEQKGFFNDYSFYIIDFYLPKPYKLCIEIDGDVHDSFEQKIKDNKKDWYLKNLRKFNVLRLTNEKAELITIDELKKVLFSVLK